MTETAFNVFISNRPVINLISISLSLLAIVWSYSRSFPFYSNCIFHKRWNNRFGVHCKSIATAERSVDKWLCAVEPCLHFNRIEIFNGDLSKQQWIFMPMKWWPIKRLSSTIFHSNSNSVTLLLLGIDQNSSLNLLSMPVHASHSLCKARRRPKTKTNNNKSGVRKSCCSVHFLIYSKWQRKLIR